MVVALAMEMMMFSGCAHKNLALQALQTESLSGLDQARLAYESGEYYKARVQVQALLKDDPENTAAQQLMGDVLDKEIARQKESLLASPATQSQDDNQSDDSNQTEVKNWLERSRTLLHQRQYDIALFAAEKVFVYDPDSHEASLLIDDIKDEAVKNGKAESLFLSKMYKEEIGERVKKYRSEAQSLVEENKNEQAKFTLQKILMLEPEDHEALRLFHDLEKKEARA